MEIARATIRSQEFIDILSYAGREFCYYLDTTVISSFKQQEIYRATNDADAMHLIRQVK